MEWGCSFYHHSFWDHIFLISWDIIIYYVTTETNYSIWYERFWLFGDTSMDFVTAPCKDLPNFKSLIKKWLGPTCSCCVCTLVVLFLHQLIMIIMIHVRSYFTTLFIQCSWSYRCKHCCFIIIFKNTYIAWDFVVFRISIYRTSKWPVYLGLISLKSIVFPLTQSSCLIDVWMDHIEYFVSSVILTYRTFTMIRLCQIYYT